MKNPNRKKKWIKTLQFLAAYLVAAWTFLQFVDWILNRYDISPNWVDLLLWIFVGIIPSVLIYFYNQDRINEGILKLREKIIFPLNVIVLAVVTYFGFGNSDLGATTKEISYTTDSGELASQTIIKEEFRIGLPIFEFEPKNTDTSFYWLQDGIQELLHQDLLQNKNLSTYMSDSEGTVNKVAESRIFNEFYLDGTYEVKDSIYKVTPTLRNAKNGKVLKEETFEGEDILSLIDDVSVFVKNNVGITENQLDIYIDLNVSDLYSNNLEAIKANLAGDYQKAQELDSTFALSYFENAFRFVRYSFGAESEKALIDKAYRYSNKLPLQSQLKIRILRHIAYEEWDIAEKLLKLQLEIDPSSEVYNNLLYAVYGETKQVDAFMKHAEDRYNKNKSIDNGTNLMEASLVAGRYDNIISAIKALEFVQPDNPDLFSFKLRPQLLKGEIKEAKKTQENVKLLHPDWKNFSPVFDTVINYLENNKVTTSKLKRFVGKFRHQSTQQTYEYWLDEGRLIAYVSNQRLYAPILSSDNSVVIGSYINKYLNHIKFLVDENGEIYGTKNTSYSFREPSNFWYWSYDEPIEYAENALRKGNLDEAEELYKEAIAKHPKHYFLKLALQHIEFVKSMTEEQMEASLSKFTGNYQGRRFWIENGTLLYQRDGNPVFKLLPIGDNRFINLLRLNIQYGFETTETGQMASSIYIYDNELEEWKKDMENNNYLLKDE